MLTLINGLVGAVVAVPIAGLHADTFTFAFLLQTATMFSVGISVLAEAGDMLFNRFEAEVLGPHPVGDRTLVAAKAINCACYAAWLALALNLVPAFAGLTCPDATALFPVAHLLASVLTAMICASSTVLVYEVSTRLASRERFDDVVAWAQVAMGVAFTLGYFVMPSLLQRAGSVSVPADRWWLALLPPAWMAALEGTLGGGMSGAMVALLGSAAIVVPLAAGWLGIVRLSRGHLEALSHLSETPARPAMTDGRRPGQRTARLSRSWPLRGWLSDPAERAAFRAVMAYLVRDRELRTRVYPQLGVLVMFPLLGWLSAEQDGGIFFAMACLATTTMLPAAVVDLLSRSPNHAAADVFFAAPLAGPGRLFLGSAKAAAVLFLPASLALALAFLAISSRSLLVTAQLCLAALLAMPAFTLLPGVIGTCVPLARPVVRGEQSLARIVYPLIGMTSLGGIFWMAWSLRGSPAGWAFLAAEGLATTLVAWMLHRRILSASWERED